MGMQITQMRSQITHLKSGRLRAWPGLALALALACAAVSCGGDDPDTGAGAGTPDSAAPVTSPPSTAAPDAPPSTTVAPAADPPTTTAPPPTTDPAPASPLECAALVSPEVAAGQLVLTLAGQSEIAEVTEPIIDGRLGGLVLTGAIDTTIGELLAPFAGVQPAPLIAADEEGGLVQRLEEILGDQPSARDVGDTGDPETALEIGRERAAGASGVGVNMILAPNLDVGNSAGLVSRTYGDDAETVIRFGLAYAAGIMESDVVAVAKHFPGHGSTKADSHLELPVTPPFEELRESHLAPFAAAVQQLPAVMTSHLDVPGLTEDGQPVTFSAAAVGVLREELGFDGVVMSDALTMDALQPLTVAQAGELAMAAGHDLLIAGRPSDSLATVDLLAEAVVSGRLERGRIDEALVRVLALKGVDPCTAW